MAFGCQDGHQELELLDNVILISQFQIKNNVILVEE
ncbi:MAG: hypothetical protein RL582_2000 [Bacteroidota bacterium]